MRAFLLKSTLVGALSLIAYSAQANMVTNGSFETCSGTPAQTNPSANKTSFTSCAPTGWSGGGGLTYVDAPGTADGSGYLQVYSPFPATSPNGGNFVQADGNPDYSGAFSQMISGLTVGGTYTLGFYQAAGQQTTFNGATTEQWKVMFGSDLQYSSLMSTPSHGVTGWELQSLTFTASTASQLLSFLAWGDGGSTVNLPPIVFLDGVSLNRVPEPGSMSLFALALLACGAVGLRRRRPAKRGLEAV